MSERPAQTDTIGAQSIRRVRRIGTVTFWVLMVVLTALGGRLLVLQLSYRDAYEVQARRQHERSRTLLARRGLVMDCRGRILAGSVEQHTCFADPFLIDDMMGAARALSPVLDVPIDTLYWQLVDNSDRRYVVLQRLLDADTADRIRNLGLRGIALQADSRRTYPQGSLAAHILGFVGVDDKGLMHRKGLEGVEFKFDSILAGQDGRDVYLQDAAGRPIWQKPGRYRPARNGGHVMLTIDAVIQEAAERRLAESCEHFRAQAGSVVVMDPGTGAILAMANWPTFDPNDVSDTEPAQRRNRAITDPYEPGSTFKPFIAAVALEQRVATIDETIFCHDGAYRMGRRTLHDHDPYGDLTVAGIVVHSSNIGMAILGERLGNERLYEAVRRYGFGQVLGIELPAENGGIVRPLKRWNQYSTGSIPMGQEVAVTTLQLTSAFASMANGGILYRPRVVRAVLDPEGNVAMDLSEPLQIRRVMREDVAHAMVRRILTAVVDEGTGRRCRIEGYRVFGKTGTAQVARSDGRGYEPGAYVGSFMGGLPSDDPQLVAVVSIRKPDPKKGYYGGTVAAPVVREVLAEAALYLGIEPDQALLQQNHEQKTLAGVDRSTD